MVEESKSRKIGGYYMKIIVIDDEKTLRWAAEKALKAKGFDVISAEDGKKGLELIEKTDDVSIVISDIKMPHLSGLELLKIVKEKRPEIFVIMISAFGDMKTTIEAMKLGAYDFLLKPFDIAKMIAVVEKALRARENMKKIEKSKGTKLEKTSIIGRSPVMQEIYKLIGKIATSDVTVLVTGESGSGKEVIARAIHHNSLRASKPFMAINCTALQETLIESELFGHEKGAFTGAYTQKLGKFELANGGTVFLDEIGDMSPELQAKLLRVMEERRFVRVGGTRETSVDIRIIAATNRNLEKAIMEGNFREDLYHRIKVINIKLPPLRERMEDIPSLVEHFLSMRSMDNSVKYRISDEALDKLQKYEWPGNVRELKNVIESALAISRDSTIFPEHVLVSRVNQGKLMAVKEEEQDADPWKILENSLETIVHESLDDEIIEAEEGEVYALVMDRIEGVFIKKVYDKLGKNQLKTAKVLGINRNTLRSKLEKYNIT